MHMFFAVMFDGAYRTALSIFFFVLQVSVNGKDFYQFQHRMPLERVCALEIGGDVAIDSINIMGVRDKQGLKNLQH